jgi:menaquinone-9 beta-reductase
MQASPLQTAPAADVDNPEDGQVGKNARVSENTLTVDVAIVGGGIAGSALAIALRGHGIDVAVIEREARFRDRVRGDALFPWGAAEAARLGIADALVFSGARPLSVWQTYEDRQPRPPYDWREDVPTGDVVWGVNHPGLQQTLLQRAKDLGARVIRPAKAIAPARVNGSGIEIQLASSDEPALVRARLAVGADGSESGVRRWIGAKTIRDPVHHLIGGCLVENVALDTDAAHVSRFSGGMALVFRHASGRARTYLVLPPDHAARMRGQNASEQFLAMCAKAFPAGAFEDARAVGPAAFFPGIDTFSSRIAGDGIVLIGDAAGANDPSQGQGLSLALRDVRELSHLLATVADWQRGIEEFSRRRPTWYEPLRAYARWQGPLTTETGPEADAARERAKCAAEADSWRNGYGAIHALGPEGLPVTDDARRRFLGEDLA